VGTGYVRPHPGLLPQEKGNRRQSQSSPMIPVDGWPMAQGRRADQKQNRKISMNLNRAVNVVNSQTIDGRRRVD